MEKQSDIVEFLFFFFFSPGDSNDMEDRMEECEAHVPRWKWGQGCSREIVEIRFLIRFLEDSRNCFQPPR